MKRKIKRSVFLMSMAVAASFPVGAFASGGGKVERNLSHYSNGGRGAPTTDLFDLIQEAPEMRIDGEGGGISSRLFGKLKGVAQSLGSQLEAVSASDLHKEWKLQLSQPESARLGATDNPRVASDKPVGVVLRLEF